MTGITIDDRAALEEAAQILLVDKCPLDSVLIQAEQGAFDPTLWAQVAEVGWLGLAVPESHGGIGGSFGDTLRLCVKVGRYLAPLPFLESAVLGTSALITSAPEVRDRWLPALAAGSSIATAALTGPSGRPGSRYLGVSAARTGRDWVLMGTAGFVPYAAVADVMIVAAHVGGGQRIFVVDSTSPGVNVIPHTTWDVSRRYGDVQFASVRVPGVQCLNDEQALGRLLTLAAAAVACDSLGGAEQTMGTTVEYGRNRVQFGRPIGSFQAWKHRAADLAISLQAAQAAVRLAERAHDQGTRAKYYSSVAKFVSSDAGVAVAEDCIQLSGGIGYTWEYGMHAYLKRAKANQALFGDSDFHRDVAAGCRAAGSLARPAGGEATRPRSAFTG